MLQILLLIILVYCHPGQNITVTLSDVASFDGPGALGGQFSDFTMKSVSWSDHVLLTGSLWLSLVFLTRAYPSIITRT